MGSSLRRNASMLPGPPAVRSVKGDYLSLSGNHPILKTLSKQGEQSQLQCSQVEVQGRSCLLKLYVVLHLRTRGLSAAPFWF